MDYFAVGGRPLLSRFPPHFLTQRIPYDQDALLAAGFIPQAPPGAQGGVDLHEGVDGGASGSAAAASNASGNYAQNGYNTEGVMQDHLLPFQVPQAKCGQLHAAFDAPSMVKTWIPANFEMIRKLQDATRNRGFVNLMRDVSRDCHVAVKQMPNRWIRESHQAFVAEHPSETELPWQDVGCIKFLNNNGYLYGCQLIDVFTDDQHTYVATSFATEGDLFSWCEVGVPPGPEREELVRPIARQIMTAIKQLHDFSIVHRDLSLENILLAKSDTEEAGLQVRIIDFSMASTNRQFRNCVRGKASYQAPELHSDQEYDAFLSDVFSLGVTLYALLLKDYPWLSTRPGGCKCFEYVRKHGFRSYLAKRKLRNSGSRVAEFMSEPVKQLLEGMLALDPAERLTLGESAWKINQLDRRSIWDESWLNG